MRVDETRIKPRRIIGDFLSKPQDEAVVARTTDSFIHNEIDTGAYTDAKMLESLVGSTIKLGATITQENAKGDALQGKQDALEGKDKGSVGFLHSNEAYAQGYHGVEDSANAVKLKGEYLERLEQNDYFIKSPNAKATKDAVFKELYSKYFPEDYMKSNGRDGLMTDRGLAVLEEAQAVGELRYSQRHQEHVKQTFVDSAYVNIADDIGTYTSETLSATIDAEYEDFIEENGEVMSKVEYQGLIIDKLSIEAIEKVQDGDIEGADRLVENIMNLKDNDGPLYERILDTDAKTGKVTHTFKDRLDALQKEVLSEKVTVEKAKEKAKEHTQDEYLVRLNANIALAHAEPDPMKRSKLLSNLHREFIVKMLDGTIIDPAKAKTYRGLLEGFKGNGNFPEVTNENVHMIAKSYVNKAGATVEELTDMYGPYIKADDFGTLIDRIYTNSKMYKQVGTDRVKKVEKFLKEHVTRISKYWAKGNMKIVQPLTAERIRMLEDGTDNLINEYVMEHGKLPTELEIRSMVQEVERDIDKVAPDEMTNTVRDAVTKASKNMKNKGGGDGTTESDDDRTSKRGDSGSRGGDRDNDTNTSTDSGLGGRTQGW